MLTGEVPFQAENLVGVAMKHVNERMPDVQGRRPEVSSALAAVVERATEKKPERRYPDMAAMLVDLENALEVEVARAGRSTGEATTVLDSVPHRRRRILASRRVSMAGILLVLAGTAAALLIAGLTGDDEGRGGGGGSEEPTGTEVELVGAQDFDPFGGDGEHPEEAALAVDGDSATTWPTEEYTASAVLTDAAGKPGVGLIVDAGQPVQGTSMSISSSEGGWDADIYAAAEGPPEELDGWGEPVGEVAGANPDEQIELDVPEPAQYYLIWLTKLAGSPGEYKVEISEALLTAI